MILKGEKILKLKGLKNLILLALVLFLFTGCINEDTAAPEVRAGVWVGDADFAKVTLTINEGGTSITRAVIEYTCKSGGLSLSETVNLNGGEKGWAIQNNKFVIDMLADAQLKISGKFNIDNTEVKGTLAAMKCSGAWEASR
jgi:hypothetical protein